MIKVHCDGPDCIAARLPSSRATVTPPVRSPHGPSVPALAPTPKWLSLKRGETLFDFCSSTCLHAWAGSQPTPAQALAAELGGKSRSRG